MLNYKIKFNKKCVYIKIHQKTMKTILINKEEFKKYLLRVDMN